MEELAATLESSFQVTEFPNNPHAPHPRFSQYKIRNKSSHQDERRRQMLERQKKNRYDYVNYVRKLTEDEKAEDNAMDWVASGKHKSSSKKYRNQLMLSEWLVDVPEDLETQWYFLLCPEGKRALIVTANGWTKCYTKGGYCIKSFPSSLPGGSKRLFDPRSKDYTMLDCIFNEVEGTYYVLDVLCWRGHPVFDSETEFRFYWLKAKLEETPGAQEKSSHNPYRFLSLPYYQCTMEALSQALWSPLPFTPKLDGLLFYHKQTHYTQGPTPLVGWLKAYMIPEMFHIDVPDTFLSDKPAEYTCMTEHLRVAMSSDKSSNKKSNNKKSSNKKKTKDLPMEISTQEDDGDADV